MWHQRRSCSKSALRSARYVERACKSCILFARLDLDVNSAFLRAARPSCRWPLKRQVGAVRLWWRCLRPSPEEAMRAMLAAENGEAAAEDPRAGQGRWLCWESVTGELSMGHLPPPAGKKGRGAPMQPLHALSLLPGEHILQVLPPARCRRSVPAPASAVLCLTSEKAAARGVPVIDWQPKVLAPIGSCHPTGKFLVSRIASKRCQLAVWA